jgi:hypothetical protein
MERPGGSVSPGLQIVLISALAAGLGVLAGGVLVYLQQRQDTDTKRRQRSALISSRSNSSSAPVPLFDSVQVTT